MAWIRKAYNLDKKQVWSCLHGKEARSRHINSDSFVKELLKDTSIMLRALEQKFQH